MCGSENAEFQQKGTKAADGIDERDYTTNLGWHLARRYVENLEVCQKVVDANLVSKRATLQHAPHPTNPPFSETFQISEDAMAVSQALAASAVAHVSPTSG